MSKLIRVLTICLLLVAPATWAQPQLLDRVIAVVNDDVILQSELDQLVQTVKLRAQNARQSLPSETVLNQQALERLIENSLQLQIAQRVGLRISDRQLDETLGNIATEQGLTIAQLQRQMEASGINWASYREDIRNEITIGQVARVQVRRRINISPQEVDALVLDMAKQEQLDQKFQVSQIMLRLPDNPPPAVLEKQQKLAVELIRQVRVGADFRELAIAYSQGPATLEGGKMPPMTLNEMPSLFAEAIEASSRTPGDLIGPLRSGIGLHILRIDGIEGEQGVSITEVNARHILVKTSIIMSDTKARRLLDGIRQDILSGTVSFSEVAARISDDTGSAIRGGSLGWADPSIYVPQFRDATLSLPIGEVSQPFKTEHGWHIVQVEERRSRDATEEFKRESAWRMLFNRKFNEEADAWLKELRSEAYIQIIDEELKRG